MAGLHGNAILEILTRRAPEPEPESELEPESETELESGISPENRHFPCKQSWETFSGDPSPEPETEPPKTYIKETGCSVEILFL